MHLRGPFLHMHTDIHKPLTRNEPESVYPCMVQELANKMLAPMATCGLCFSGEPAPGMYPVNIFSGI